jgi:hypothetical protein
MLTLRAAACCVLFIPLLGGCGDQGASHRGPLASFVKPRPCSDTSVGQALFENTPSAVKYSLQPRIDAADAAKLEDVGVRLRDFRLNNNVDLGQDGNITICQADYVAKVEVVSGGETLTLASQTSPGWEAGQQDRMRADPAVAPTFAACRQVHPYGGQCNFYATLSEKVRLVDGVHEVRGSTGRYGVGDADDGHRLFYNLGNPIMIPPQELVQTVGRQFTCKVGDAPVTCPVSVATLFE